MLFTSLISALALPLLALANSHSGSNHARHVEIAKRAAGHVSLHKRFSNTRWTFYKTGLGACGKYNNDGDFIVALNSAQYGKGYPGPNCFKQITMSYKGKTATATIVDECPGCPFGGLDLSPGLFSFFADQSEGVISGNWNFGGGGGGGGGDDNDEKPTPSKPKPTPSPTPKPSPSPKPEPPTTTRKTTTTTTSKTSTSTSHSTTSTTSKTTTTTTTSSTRSSPSPVPTPTGSSNLVIFNEILLNMGGIAIAGAAGNIA